MIEESKLWVDNTLPPPDLHWKWAQEARAAKHVLKLNGITEVWIGLSDYDQAVNLAQWMLKEQLVPQKVVASMSSTVTQGEIARILRPHCLTFSQETHGDYPKED